MNIIILGKTNVGKTPFTELLQNEMLKTLPKDKINIISASKWVKNIYNRPENLTKEEYVKDISAFSIRMLKDNQDLDYNAIYNSLRWTGINIIDGIRNPYTFNRIFNPNEDKVLIINKINDIREFSSFDKGVDVIQYNINWLISVGLMEMSNLKTINYLENIEAEFNIKDIVGEIL